MLSHIINFSIKNKFIALLFMNHIIRFGLYLLSKTPIGSGSDLTNSNIEALITTLNISTQDMEQLLTKGAFNLLRE